MQRVVESETARSEQILTLYTEEEIQCVTTTGASTQNSIVNKSERNLPEVTSTSEETEQPSSSMQRVCMNLYEEGVIDSATIDSAFDVKDGFHGFGKVTSVSAESKLLCSDSKEGSEKVLSLNIGYDDSDNGTEADVSNIAKEIKGELSSDKCIEGELSKLFDSGTVGDVEDTKQTVNILSEFSTKDTQTVADKTETSVPNINIDNQDRSTIKGNKREEGQISNSDSSHSWSSLEEKKDSKKHKEQKKEKHHRKKTKEKKKKRKKHRKLKKHEGSSEPESGNQPEEKLRNRNRSSSPESHVRNKRHKRSRSKSRDRSSRHQRRSRTRSPDKERRQQMSKDRKSRSTSRSRLSSTKHSSSKKESDLKTVSPRGKSSNKSFSSARKRDEQSKRTLSEKDQSMSNKRKLSRSRTPPRRLSSDSKRRKSSSDHKYSPRCTHSPSRTKSSGDRNRSNSPSLSRSLDRGSRSPKRRKSSHYSKSRRSESPPVRRKLSSSRKKSKSTSKSPNRQSQSPKRRKSSPGHKSLKIRSLFPGRRDETPVRKQRNSPPIPTSQLPKKQKTSPLDTSSKSRSHSPVRRNSKKRKCLSTSKSPIRNSPSPKPSPSKEKLIAHKKRKQSSSTSKSPTERSHSLKKRKDSKGSSSPVKSPVRQKDTRNFVVSWHTMSESDIEMSDGKSPSRKSLVTEKVIVNTSTSRSPLKSEESGKHESPLSSPSKLLDDEFDYVFTERLTTNQGSEKSVEDVLFGQDPLATDAKSSSEKWSTSTAEVKGSTRQDKPVDEHQTSFSSNSQVSNEKVEKHTENEKCKEFMEDPTEVNQLQQNTENQEEMKVETIPHNAFDEKSSDPSINEEKSEVTISDKAEKIDNLSSEDMSVAGAVESPVQDSSSVQAADFEQNNKSPTGVKSESETEMKKSDFVVSKFDTIPFLDGTPPAPQTPVNQLGTPATAMGILPTTPVNQTWQGHSEGSNKESLLVPPPPVLRVAGHSISQGTDLAPNLAALGMLGGNIPQSPGTHVDNLRESDVLIRNDIKPAQKYESKLFVSVKHEGLKNFESSPLDMEMSSPEADIIDKLNEEFWKQQQQQEQGRQREEDQIREAFVEYGTTDLLPDEEPYEPEIGLLSDDMEEDDDLDNVADPKERKKRRKAKQLEKTKVQTLIDKLHRQARVEEEVKHVLKVYYKHRDIDKEEYKNILRRAVPQVTNSSSAIDPERIRSLVKKYVAKVKGQRILAV